MNIDDIVEAAKGLLLEMGDYPPAIYVELDRSAYAFIGVPGMEQDVTAMERARVCFEAGRHFGRTAYKKLKPQKVTGVCLVGKVWISMTYPEDKGKPYIRPSLHPNRKDCISFSTIEADTMEQGAIVYEILRDRSGKVVDLLHLDFVIMNIHGAFLPCFLAGFKTADQHQSRAIHEFRRTFDRHAPQVVFPDGVEDQEDPELPMHD